MLLIHGGPSLLAPVSVSFSGSVSNHQVDLGGGGLSGFPRCHELFGRSAGKIWDVQTFLCVFLFFLNNDFEWAICPLCDP